MPGLRRGSNTYKQRSSYKPGEYTIAYYPFKEDILDHSGNDKNLTGSGYTLNNGTITIPSGTHLDGPLIVPTSGSGDRTIMIYMLANKGIYHYADGVYGTNGYIVNNSSENRSGGAIKLGSTWYNDNMQTQYIKDKVHLALVKSGTSFKVYSDGEIITQLTLSTDQWYEQFATSTSTLREGTYGEIIVESKGWTQEEIREYISKNKYKYNL